MQKGITERLLCDDCEQKFGDWERYFSLVLQGGISLGYSETDNGLLIEGLEYEKVKLFEMSVLWRASISTHAMFKNISLGPHEEKLRDALFKREAKADWEYGCGLFAILDNGKLQSDIMDQAENGRTDGLRTYCMIFGGYIWTFFVGSHQPPTALRAAFLQRDGSRLVMRKEFKELKHLVHFANELKSMGRFPRV